MRLYGLLKLHKVKDPKVTTPPFRPIVSSLGGTYNNNLTKYLCSLLKRHISSRFCATDTFSSVRAIQDIDFSDLFLVSYDVTSLFTNIPVSETIDLAGNTITDSDTGPDIKLDRSSIIIMKTTLTRMHVLVSKNMALLGLLAQ